MDNHFLPEELTKSSSSSLASKLTNQIANAGAAVPAAASKHHLSLLDEFATCCTVLAVGIASYQIIMHLKHFNEPQIQL